MKNFITHILINIIPVSIIKTLYWANLLSIDIDKANIIANDSDIEEEILYSIEDTLKKEFDIDID